MVCNQFSVKNNKFGVKNNSTLTLESNKKTINLDKNFINWLVSKIFKIRIEDTKGKIQYFSNITECSLNLKISSKIIKNCLISGNPYKNYTFKFDTVY